MKTIPKPEPNEYAPYASMYIDLLPDDGLVLKHLEDNVRATTEFMRAVPEEKLSFRYSEGKWTIKEIIAHLIDDERVYAYRALRFARNDQTELPGFEQEDYAVESGANQRSLDNLLEEFAAVRKSTIALFNSFDDRVLTRSGVASGNAMSVRAIAYHLAGHELRHMNIIKERYLASASLGTLGGVEGVLRAPSRLRIVSIFRRGLLVLIPIFILSIVLAVVLSKYPSKQFTILGVLAALVLILTIWKLPKWQLAPWKDKLEPKEVLGLENSARATLTQIIVGVVLLLGLYFTAENIRVTQDNATNTQNISRDAQVTQSFSKAVEQLETDDPKKLSVRLGGIYALERITRESPKDHWPIMEVLTAYVRSHVRCKKCWESPHLSELVQERSPDIQAILTVLGRRRLTYNQGENDRLNLAYTNLSFYDLTGLHLEGAIFTGSSLGANLAGAYMEEADFLVASLRGARLDNAHMRKANFSGAHLNPAFFFGTNLQEATFNGADVTGASFKGADLRGADLSLAKGLTWEQLQEASIDEHTKLPGNLEQLRQAKRINL